MTTQNEWLRVNKTARCGICGRDSWCTITSDGKIACCMRIESAKPCKNGGWIHRLGDDIQVKIPAQKPKKATAPTIDFSKLAIDCFHRDPDRVRNLAVELGLQPSSLIELQVGTFKDVWTFPMKNARCKIIGIRTRFKDGSKKSMTGSKNGLFISIRKHIATLPLFICEGPTDTAALMDLGLQVIGRPSCSGAMDLVFEYIELGRYREVIILADKDSPKKRPDGSVFYPGHEGAERLAQHLKPLISNVKVIKPPKDKDARKWVQSGATAQTIACIVANTGYS